MELSHILFALFARQNPALKPRFAFDNARRWAATGINIARQRDVFDKTWALNTLLDEASVVTVPEGYQSNGEGSRRRQANDGGGIEGKLLLKLAEAIAKPRNGEAEKAGLWAQLYPYLYDACWGTILDWDAWLDNVVGEWDLYDRNTGFLKYPQSYEYNEPNLTHGVVDSYRNDDGWETYYVQTRSASDDGYFTPQLASDLVVALQVANPGREIVIYDSAGRTWMPHTVFALPYFPQRRVMYPVV